MGSLWRSRGGGVFCGVRFRGVGGILPFAPCFLPLFPFTIFALFKATRENEPQRRKGRKDFLFYLLLCDLCVSAVKSYFCKHRALDEAAKLCHDCAYERRNARFDDPGPDSV